MNVVAARVGIGVEGAVEGAAGVIEHVDPEQLLVAMVTTVDMLELDDETLV